MSKVALQKIRVTGFKRHYKILMQELHQSGILQLSEVNNLNQYSVVNQPDEHYGAINVARTEFALNFLQPYQTVTSKLDNFLSGGKIVLNTAQMSERLKVFAPEAEKVIADCEKLEETLVRARNERAGLPKKLDLVINLKGLHSTIQADFDTQTTKTAIGKLPLTEKSSLMRALAAESNLIDLSILGESKLYAYVRVTTLKSMSAEVNSKLQTFDFESIDLMSELEAFEGQTPSHIKAELSKEAKALDAQIAEAEMEAKALSVHVRDLKILAEQQNWKQTKNAAQVHMFLSEKTFSFEAWIIKSSLEDFTAWINNAFVGEVVAEKIKITQDEKVPTMLSNNFVVKSFEPITEMYGLPRKQEFDPTIWLAPFFLIFFGLCLSDVGYGALLALAAGFFLVFGKLSSAANSSLRLLLYCGIAAIVGGVLLGGYFGLTVAQFPAMVDPDTGNFYGQVLTPTEGTGPITFLVLSLALGAIHLLFGMILAFTQQIKNKDYSGAFLDTAMWMFMLFSIGLYALGESIGVGKPLATNLVIVAAIGLVITQGRGQKNWLLKPLFGVLGLYNITAYLSDLLSYSRIMALGLATGVVGFAMNLTAIIFSDMMPHPVLGILIAVIIVVFGHSLNFGLSLLGAFIHSGRLQFIEFFGKFYESGSERFIPFVREMKYITLQDKS
jgi:V/A-type H+-transporting ATPase subunit I